MTAKIEIEIDAYDIENLEWAIHDAYAMSSWKFTNAGSPSEIARHSAEIDENWEWSGEDSGDGWDLTIKVKR